MTDYDMTPKKAMVIVLIMFLVVAIIFVVLYVNNKPAANQLIEQPIDNGYNSISSQEKLSPAQQKIEAIETKTRNQVEQIVEQGRTASGGITADAQKKIDEAVNQEIIEKMKLRTPEQLKADEQRRAEQAERDRLINEQIKSQLQNK